MSAPLYLASRSPRRQELLQQLGIEFELLDCEVDERPKSHESAKLYVLRICRKKLSHACQLIADNRPVLVADTVVVIDDQILGKPNNLQAAKEMLSQLSGRKHQVFTAVGVGNREKHEVRLNVSTVHVTQLSPQQIQIYLNCQESLDKAGAYGIQGRFAAHISHLEGSYSGVMGLPLFEAASLLEEFNIL